MDITAAAILAFLGLAVIFLIYIFCIEKRLSRAEKVVGQCIRDVEDRDRSVRILMDENKKLRDELQNKEMYIDMMRKNLQKNVEYYDEDDDR